MSAEYKVTKGIYTRKYQAKNIWEVGGACVEKQRKIRTTHGLCECCASVVRVSHKLKVLCEFRTSLEQLSSEGHIFLISAPNRTQFEALDS